MCSECNLGSCSKWNAKWSLEIEFEMMSEMQLRNWVHDCLENAVRNGLKNCQINGNYFANRNTNGSYFFKKHKHKTKTETNKKKSRVGEFSSSMSHLLLFTLISPINWNYSFNLICAKSIKIVVVSLNWSCDFGKHMMKCFLFLLQSFYVLSVTVFFLLLLYNFMSFLCALFLPALHPFSCSFTPLFVGRCFGFRKSAAIRWHFIAWCGTFCLLFVVCCWRWPLSFTSNH